MEKVFFCIKTKYNNNNDDFITNDSGYQFWLMRGKQDFYEINLNETDRNAIKVQLFFSLLLFNILKIHK